MWYPCPNSLIDSARTEHPNYASWRSRYQKCAIVTELAQSLKIELLYLPPYSLNLNLDESIPFLLPRLIHIFFCFFKALEEFRLTLKQLLRHEIAVSILELIFVFEAFR